MSSSTDWGSTSAPYLGDFSAYMPSGYPEVPTAKEPAPVGSWITSKQIQETRWEPGALLKNVMGEVLRYDSTGAWVVLGDNLRAHTVDDFNYASTEFQLLARGA